MSAQLKRVLLILLVALVAGMAAGAYALPYGSRTMVLGMRGDDVQELQRRLRDLGYAPGPVDGIFGPLTRAAVVAFQRDHGLTGAGLAGRLTIGVLDLAFARRGSIQYTVLPGDSLYTIARQHGTDVQSIRWLNRLQSDLLYPGQKLLVPSRSLPVAPPQAPAAQRPLVVGYYAEDWAGDTRSLRSLQGAAGAVDMAVSFHLQLDAQGRVHGREPEELLRWARENGVAVQALVHNYAGGQFDREVARQVLRNATNRQRAAEAIAGAVAGKGYAGVNVDLEWVPPNLRDGYTDFVRRLAKRLQPLGMTVTVSVPAKVMDLRSDGWSGGFDYAALGQVADLVMIMAYDEHTPGWPAGPVASLGWVERVAAYAVSQMPPEKVVLGVAQYGYDWLWGSTTGRAMGSPQAESLARRTGAQITWDKTAQVPTFTYRDNQGQSRVVYYENARSLQAKLGVVHRYGLRGIALWRLGLEDPAIWPVVTRWRQAAAAP